MTATVPRSLATRAAARRHVLLFEPVARATAPHHIDDAGGKTEQQEYDQPPRRDAEPAVEPPADAGADENAGDQLGREPEPARHARIHGSRRRVFRLRRAGSAVPGRAHRRDAAVSRKEQPRRWIGCLAPSCALSGIFTPSARPDPVTAPLKAARTILTGGTRVNNLCDCSKRLIRKDNHAVLRTAKGAGRGAADRYHGATANRHRGRSHGAAANAFSSHGRSRPSEGGA